MAEEYSAHECARRSVGLILVRAAPGAAAGTLALEEARRQTARPGAVTVFLHGPGVDWACSDRASAWAGLAPRDDLELLVCQAAWQRRHGQRPPQVFTVSSLVQFWHRAVHARDLVVCG